MDLVLLPDRKILVVDDNVSNRKLSRAILVRQGCLVLEAADGAECLEAARKERPVLILMDIHMPVMDGLEALKHLQADPATCAIPVVAITASAMKGDREHFLKAGFVDYLSKPLDIDEFLEVVRRFAVVGEWERPAGEGGDI
jgi:two-component system, cell cycle response regulator DivK